MLYITGLRVSNLLLFNVRNIKELMEKGETHITLIKNKKKSKLHPITLGEKAKNYLKEFQSNFYSLMLNKNENEPFFTTQNKLHCPIHRVSFDSEINNVLIRASEKFQKHLRTHSFRASIITDYLKSTPIDVVKEVIGHKDIKTTLQYKRGQVSQHELKLIQKKYERIRNDQ